MDPRVILSKLIERLEPIVGEVSEADFGVWPDSPEEVKLDRDRSLSGWYFFAEALLEARAALRSGDASKMAKAALICPTFERNGLQEAARHAERAKRSTGGRATAEKRRREAADVWAPWTRMFKDLVVSGRTDHDARAEVIREMSREGFTLPNTGEFPSLEIIRRRLK